jgi:hypothetical protein
LDYFGARYFLGAQGRFTSPDAPFADQQAEDPQSWNLYSYVRNNPSIFTDPTGNDCVYVNSAGEGIDSINNQNTAKDCGRTGGYWVDGTVTNARFAHGSLILTGTRNGQDRTSASYGLRPEGGLVALKAAGDRASRDFSTSTIMIGGVAASYASTYAIPAVVAGLTAMGETGAVGPGVGQLNKINHIFKQTKHNLDGLVQQYGSPAAAYAALEKATVEHITARGVTSQFEEVVNVGGTNVTVRGAVVNGVVKIGTAFK